MPNQHEYHELKEVDSPPEQNNTGDAEDTPIANKNCDQYESFENNKDGSEHCKYIKGNDSKDSEEALTKDVLFQMFAFNLAFFGRGLTINCIGPTLIDLRQIASLSIEQGGWLFISQSIGYLISNLIAKVTFSKFNSKVVLSFSLFLKAISTSLVTACGNAFVMCLMLIGQGVAEGLTDVGTMSACIQLGGKKRSGVYLQTVAFSISIGSLCGPFIVRPFLSDYASRHGTHPALWHSESQKEEQLATYQPFPFTNTSKQTDDHMTNTSTTEPETYDMEFTQTHIQYYYIILGIICFIPAVLFAAHHRVNREPIRNMDKLTAPSDSITFKGCTTPLSVTAVLAFLLSFLFFATQQSYSNLVTTFAVYSSLHFAESQAVYLSSVFWTAMCIGRLIGIFAARVVTPFKMLSFNLGTGVLAGTILSVFGDKSPEILWIFTAILGLAYSTTTPGVFSWAANHLPNDTYIIILLTLGECIGVLIIPALVTFLFKVVGPMILMYSVLTSLCITTVMLISAQLIIRQYGKDGQLLGKVSAAEGLVENQD